MKYFIYIEDLLGKVKHEKHSFSGPYLGSVRKEYENVALVEEKVQEVLLGWTCGNVQEQSFAGIYSTTSMLLDWNKPILKALTTMKKIEARGLENPRRTYYPTIRHGSQYSQRHQHPFHHQQLPRLPYNVEIINFYVVFKR